MKKLDGGLDMKKFSYEWESKQLKSKQIKTAM